MATHKALGRGLNALFSDAKSSLNEAKPGATENAVGTSENEVREIPINNIKPNRHQPRITFDEASLQELSQSIKLHGLTQPLVVTESGAGEFELVVGERRLRASKMAGLASVPCLVRKMSNRERFEVALIENIQREDLNALEEAAAIDGLMREFDLTQEQVAEALGKSRSAIANSLRLLKLHEDVQTSLRSGEITEGHAKVLAGLIEHSEQLHWLQKIRDGKWSVRQLEAGLSQGKTKKKTESSNATEVADVKRYIENIQRVLGRRVEIQSQGKKGWIKFAFYSPWDLDLLCQKLGLIDAKTEEPTE